jgi:hypothetical protein
MPRSKCVFHGCNARPVALNRLCGKHQLASLNGPDHVATLRQYVRTAERHGGYQSVFDEAALDLKPIELGRLCLAMREMTYQYKSEGRTRTETFKLQPEQRDQLVTDLLTDGIKTRTVAELAGCSDSHVRKVREEQSMPSERPETGAQNRATEQPLPNACPTCSARIQAQSGPTYCADPWHSDDEAHTLPERPPIYSAHAR